MKISKSLLQAIMVGASLGAITSSCTLLDITDHIEIEEDTRDDRCDGDVFDCPACGMG